MRAETSEELDGQSRRGGKFGESFQAQRKRHNDLSAIVDLRAEPYRIIDAT